MTTMPQPPLESDRLGAVAWIAVRVGMMFHLFGIPALLFVTINKWLALGWYLGGFLVWAWLLDITSSKPKKPYLPY
jgi:hypothetical protein